MSEVMWEVESLRATAFHEAGDTPADVTKLWELLIHRRPDQISLRPNEGVQVAEGPFGGRDKHLRCTIRPQRVDWVLQAAPPDPSRPPDGLPTVGPLVGALPAFKDLGTSWLEMSSAITRLAFGAVLLVGAANPQDAYEKLSTLLQSVTLEPEDVSDFLYRINRRRALSSYEGIQANRLSTWSIIQGGSIEFAVAADGPPQFTHLTDLFACKLELDMNTVGNFASPLSGADAAQVFDELVALGADIAEQGDKS